MSKHYAAQYIRADHDRIAAWTSPSRRLPRRHLRPALRDPVIRVRAKCAFVEVDRAGFSWEAGAEGGVDSHTFYHDSVEVWQFHCVAEADGIAQSTSVEGSVDLLAQDLQLRWVLVEVVEESA